MNTWIVVLIIVLVGAGLAGMIFLMANGDILSPSVITVTESSGNVPSSTPGTSTPLPTETVPSTTPASSYIGKILITYSGATATEIGGHIYPRDLHTFLLVDFVIENHSFDVFNVNPMDFYAVIYKINYYADITSASDLADELKSVNLKSGDTARGKIAYEVPERTLLQDFQIIYKYSQDFDIIWTKKQQF